MGLELRGELRDAMGLELRGELRDARGRARAWAASGSLVLTDVRLVFVAGKASPEGLRAFDFPLQYVRGERFIQPIFGANNLAGECFRVESGGRGRPLAFKFKFNCGSGGTRAPSPRRRPPRPRRPQRPRRPSPKSCSRPPSSTRTTRPWSTGGPGGR